MLTKYPSLHTLHILWPHNIFFPSDYFIVARFCNYLMYERLRENICIFIEILVKFEHNENSPLNRSKNYYELYLTPVVFQ